MSRPIAGSFKSEASGSGRTRNTKRDTARDMKRDTERERDATRDTKRDTERDATRDTKHDTECDATRDTKRDMARDAKCDTKRDAEIECVIDLSGEASSVETQNWYVDSGATQHMTSRKDWFIDYQETTPSDIHLTSVATLYP